LSQKLYTFCDKFSFPVSNQPSPLYVGDTIRGELNWSKDFTS
jgi:hypothetical protein